MIEVTRVEQELAELEQQLEQSFRVFDELAQVQQQFAALAQTQRRFEDSIDRHNTALNQFQQDLDRRFESIETNLHRQFAPLQAEQSNLDRRLTDTIDQRIQILKRDLEQRSQSISQVAERQQDAIEAAMQQLELRLRTELDRQIEAVKQPMIPPTYVEKLDVALRNTRSNLRTVEKQIGSLQIWLALLTFGVVVALGLQLTPTFFGSR